MYQSSWTAVVRVDGHDLVVRSQRWAVDALVATNMAWDELMKQLCFYRPDGGLNSVALSVNGTTISVPDSACRGAVSLQKLADMQEKLGSAHSNGDLRKELGDERDYDIPEGTVMIDKESSNGK